MTEQEILEGNRLIAEFMGFKVILLESCVYDKEEIYRVESDTYLFVNRFTINDVAIKEGFDKTKPKEYFWKIFGKKVKYNSSWDWLMPVVEKISSLKNVCPREVLEIRRKGTGKTIVWLGEFFNSESDILILAVFESVVKFVRWYNEKQTE